MALFWKKKSASAKATADKKDDKEKKPEKSAKFDSGKKVKEEKKSMKELYDMGGDYKAPKSGKGKVDIKDKPGEKKTESKTRKHGNAYRVLVKPLVTEKAADLGKENKYAFEVNLGANKIEVAKAVEEIYGIKPLSVNIIKTGGKSVRYGRTQGKKKNRKKAIVKLPEGKSIKIYEGV